MSLPALAASIEGKVQSILTITIIHYTHISFQLGGDLKNNWVKQRCRGINVLNIGALSTQIGQ